MKIFNLFPLIGSGFAYAGLHYNTSDLRTTLGFYFLGAIIYIVWAVLYIEDKIKSKNT